MPETLSEAREVQFADRYDDLDGDRLAVDVGFDRATAIFRAWRWAIFTRAFAASSASHLTVRQ